MSAIASRVGNHAPPPARSPEQRTVALRWLTPLRVHLVSLLVGAGILGYANRNDWFFGDEWDFLLLRGLHHPLLGIWAPHNEHWSTLPILLYRAVVSIDGMHSIVPTIAVLLVAHLCVCHLLWRISLRCGADPWIATALVTIFVLLGSGAENLTSGFQIGFVGSVLFGLAALEADRLRVAPVTRLALNWVFLVCSLMCSGIGIAMTAASGFDQALRRGLRWAALTVSVPAVVYLVWYALAGRGDGNTVAGQGQQGLAFSHITLASLLAVPSYVWTGVTAAIGNTVAIGDAGTVLLLVLLAWVFYNVRETRTQRATALALGGGTIALYLLFGIARSGTPIPADASRYIYEGVALLLPLAGIALSDLVRSAGRRSRPILYGLIALSLISNVGSLRTQANSVGAADQAQKVQILAAARVLADGDRALSTRPLPAYVAYPTSAEILRAERAHEFPHPTLSPVQIVTAQSVLNISLTRNPVFSRHLRPSPSPAHGSCVTAAVFTVSVPHGGGSLALRSPMPVILGVTLQGTDDAQAPVENFSFPAGTSNVNISASGTTAKLQISRLPGFTYCAGAHA